MLHFFRSWGEYWGENGYARVERGVNMLGIEASCSWATVDQFTTKNVACYEDGSNCVATAKVVDPAAHGTKDVAATLKKRFQKEVVIPENRLERA